MLLFRTILDQRLLTKISKELASEHGPNISLDTEILMHKLRTKNGDKVSCRDYVTEFERRYRSALQSW